MDPPCGEPILWGISPDFSGLSHCAGQVAYALLTRAPVAGRREQALSPVAPRLACVRPVASVHPEPGSNSPLFVSFFYLFHTFTKPPAHHRLTYLDLNWLEALFTNALVLFLVYLIISMFLRFRLPNYWRKGFAKLSQNFELTKSLTYF